MNDDRRVFGLISAPKCFLKSLCTSRRQYVRCRGEGVHIVSTHLNDHGPCTRLESAVNPAVWREEVGLVSARAFHLQMAGVAVENSVQRVGQSSTGWPIVFGRLVSIFSFLQIDFPASTFTALQPAHMHKQVQVQVRSRGRGGGTLIRTHANSRVLQSEPSDHADSVRWDQAHERNHRRLPQRRT